MSHFPTKFSVEHPTGASFETANGGVEHPRRASFERANVSVEQLMGASFEREAGR
jgi:hypothetical protein